MGSLTDIFVAVKSDMSPFEKDTKSGLASAGKQFEKSGKNVGKLFADAASAAAKSKIEDLGKKAAAAADMSADATGKLRVAEAKLAEVRSNSKAKASQVAAAEEAVAAAQRKSTAATKNAESATEALTKARKAATSKALQASDGESERKGNESGKRFGIGFSKSIPALGGRVSGMMSTGLKGAAGAALAGGAILGAALLSGFKEALEQGDVKAKFQAQLGLSDADSAKAGKVAGDLYKANYGESLAGVNDAIRSVVQNTNVGLNSVDLQPVTAKVLNLASAFDQDLGGTTRAVGQLIRTGLAKDATQALDIITKGFQSGADKSEDFLDTLNEYGTQFRKVGIDGATATGIISQGLKAGARDADIVADAIKEFSIRAIDGSKATSDGFKALGIDAEKMSQTIARGGKPAAAGLDQVLDRLRGIKDPVKQSQIAVQLFGTQAEDLGKALFAIDPSKAVSGLGQVAGAAERMDKTLGETPQARVSSFFRTLKQGAVDSLGGVIQAFATGETSATGFQGELEKAAIWLEANKFQIAAVFVDITRGAVGLAKTVLPVIRTLDQQFRGWLGGMLEGAAKAFGWIPEVGPRLQKASESFNSYSAGVDKAFDVAINKANEWDVALDKTSKELHLKADISDLEGKLKIAKASLADKSLTKERRAEITANIKDLQAKLAAAKSKAMLADPKLVQARVAKLQADKRDLDAKIAAAKVALANPKLTATKRAKLDADKRALEKKLREAQAQINGLKGKTVLVRYSAAGVTTWTAASTRGGGKQGGIGSAGMATGGPVRGPGGPTDDRVPIMASAGEHMWTAREVQAAGGHKAILQMRKQVLDGHQHLAAGGPVINMRKQGVFPSVAAGQKYVDGLFGGGAPSGPPGARQRFRGQTLNTRTIKMLLNAERILGAAFHITQGSYSTRVAASGGTHSGGGAMDTNGPRGWGAAVSALRKAGFAAWHRTPSQGPWNHHIHSIALGDTSASPSAKRQMASFRAGRNGLGGMAKGGPVLMDGGGWLPTGRSLVDNKTGKPEPLARMDLPMELSDRSIERLADAIAKRPTMLDGRLISDGFARRALNY